MTRPLVILGASGNALDIRDVVDAVNAHNRTWEVVGILDDGRPLGADFHGLTVLGPLADARRLGDCFFINAIGSDSSFAQRPRLVASTGVGAERFATLIHPLAAVSARATLGRGTLINAGVSVAGNVSIGEHVSLGPGSIVGHDTIIESHAMLAPGAIVSGACHLSTACYIGAGAMIRQQVHIGNRALIGIGAVVLSDVDPATSVVGNPARLLKRRTAVRIESARA